MNLDSWHNTVGLVCFHELGMNGKGNVIYESFCCTSHKIQSGDTAVRTVQVDTLSIIL